MALAPGTKLGPYLIEALLGTGGMGEVYRAVDTRLRRPVAIKVLASTVADDVQFQRRFEREARAIAALEHPHICALYDVGEHDGAGFIVMQFLDGQSLAKRLDAGPLRLDEVIRYGVQLARALHAAHRAGLVHRDLKPGNVMLTRSGAKLLDFGLARYVSGAGSGISTWPTQEAGAAPITSHDALIGTVPYMAPEQLEGKEADARTDIFALGAVLYELATGRRPFAGGSHAALFAAILEGEPRPMTRLRPDVPASLERIVTKCLAKDPDARWQSANDLADALSWIDDSTIDPSSAVAARSAWWKDARVWLLAAGAGLLATLGAWLLRPIEDPVRLSARFPVHLPMGVRIAIGDSPLAFSPDGRDLVYAGVRDGERLLFVRSLDGLESHPLQGTSGASGPFFSPDGKWLGFQAGGEMRRLPTTGGAPEVIVSGPNVQGAAWGADGRIVFAAGTRTGLSVIGSDGARPGALTVVDPAAGESSHRHPEMLPGSRAVIFTAGPPALGDWFDANLVVQSFDAGERRILVRGAAQGRYVHTGHLVYARAGVLFGVPLDLETLSVSGNPVKLLDGVREDQSSGASQFAISAAGALAYVPGGLSASEIVWIDRQGSAESLLAPPDPRFFYQPRFSPDGRRLALIVASGNDDIWLYDLGQDLLTRLSSGANHLGPAWTPDGGRISYTKSNTGEILLRTVEGSADPELLGGGRQPLLHSWAPDGRLAAVTDNSPDTGFDIWILDVESRRRRPFMQTPFAEVSPMISPNGRWIAFASNETGRFQIYVAAFNDGGGKQQVSRDGGLEPVWARNGQELFFRQDNKLMAAAAIGGGGIFDRPRELFEHSTWVQAQTFRPNYDVAPDGRRFAIVSVPQPPSTTINIVLNWTAELTRRVPR